MSKTYIIDGNSLLFRAFYALYRPGEELMHSQDGTPTNAIFSFRNMMKTIRSQLTEGDRMIVCFDTEVQTFRSKELETYKKNRKPLEPALKAQLPLARTLLDAMGIFYYEYPGYEGDDVAGSLAVYGAARGDDIELFTSDKDFLQLLGERIKVNFLRRGLTNIEVFTADNIKEKLGFCADQVTDYKGLVGDASDNFKGIPGIGEKTAVKLLSEYGHLEDIIAGLTGKPGKTALNICEHADEGRFCKHLATIITDLDICAEVYDRGLVKDPNYEHLKAFYLKYGLNSFLKQLESERDPRASERMTLELEDERQESLGRFGFTGASTFQKAPITLQTIDGLGEIKAVVADYEGENPHKGQINGFQLFDGESNFFISAEDASSDPAFAKLLSSGADRCTFDLKALIVVADRLGLPSPVGFTFDLLLATYLLDPDVESSPSEIVLCYGLKGESTAPYALLAAAASNLRPQVLTRLEENGELSLFTDVEMPLAVVLAAMEIEGFPLDLTTLKEIDRQYKAKLKKIKDDIFAYAGHELNLNSPKQVGTFLFDELGLKGPRSKSTSFEVLKSMSHLHPVVKLLIDYRKTNKSITSYTEALPQHVFPDGKIHAVFNQALTTTGRLSMKEPNLQNISIRTEEGKEIRKAFFYPDREFYILSFDYSQIELRLVATLADVKPLIAAFDGTDDIHTMTASACFHVPASEVTPEMRRRAKAVNFGIVYGISTYGLSEQLGISVPEAKEIMESFHRAFPGLEEYDRKVIEFAQSHEYVTTVLNRRRYLKDINSSNHTLREFSKRAAVNATVQGSAADLIKVAMVKISELLKDYRTKMVLQIHDELIFKVPPDELEMVAPKIKEIMENALKLSCHLEVEGSYAFSWYEAK